MRWNSIQLGRNLVFRSKGFSCRGRVRSIAFGLGVLLGSVAGSPVLADEGQLPAFQYAIVYKDLLEFSGCASMVVNGPVYADGPIYTGSTVPLVFNGTVQTADTLSSPPNNGQSNWPFTGIFNGSPGLITNAPPFYCPVRTNWHELINLPAPGEDPLSNLGALRLYNQAQTVLLVATNTVTFRVQTSSGSVAMPGVDPCPAVLVASYSATNLQQLSNSFPFLGISNSFYDQRESKTVQLSQIDLGRYGQWLQTNPVVQAKLNSCSSPYAPLLYVADLRPASRAVLPAVRLTNALAVPANGGLGFSVATPNPLYVLGHYNCTNSAWLGTTNTAASASCALYCDALTVLSPGWEDQANSSDSLTPQLASSTTLNAAILAGNVPGTNSSFSGGVQNLPRLLENWSGQTLTLNTSLACLYASAQATGPFLNPTVYYSAPTRLFSFDSRFADSSKLPPGTPMLVFTNLERAGILANPVSHAVPEGSNVLLRVRAGGTEPLRYQWRQDGVPVGSSATNTTLMLPAVGPGNVGAYDVVVTNCCGSVTSAPAQLSLASAPAFLWARTGASGTTNGAAFGLTPDSVACSLSVDAGGNVFAAGVACRLSLLDFGGATLSDTNKPLDGFGFLCKYDAMGNCLWARQVGTNASTIAVQVDASGTPYLMVRCVGAFPLGTNAFDSNGESVVYLAQFSSSGELGWVRRIQAQDTNFVTQTFGLAVDSTNGVFAAGKAAGSAAFGALTLTNCGGFLAHYDRSGNLLWAQPAIPADTLARAGSGNLFVSGYCCQLAKYDSAGAQLWVQTLPFWGAALAADDADNVFVGGKPCLALAKYNAQGQVLWSRSLQTSNSFEAQGIALDEFNNLFLSATSLSGRSESALTIGSSTLTNVCGFVAKYDAAGHSLWALPLGCSNPCGVFTVGVQPAGAICIGGYYCGSASLGGLGVQNLVNNWPASGRAFFVAALDGREPAVAPRILTGPQSQTVLVGQSPSFTADVTGTAPLCYQWACNDTPLAGATNLTLVLSNVSVAQAGSYSLSVSNQLGSDESASAQLGIVESALSRLETFGLTAQHQATFRVSGCTGLCYTVEGSTNLLDWVRLLTNTPPFEFTDTNAAQFPVRFYRVVYRP